MNSKVNTELLEAFFMPIVEPLIKSEVEEAIKKSVDQIELRMRPEQPLGVKSIANIPHHKISGGKLLFYVSEINEWIRSKK